MMMIVRAIIFSNSSNKDTALEELETTRKHKNGVLPVHSSVGQVTKIRGRPNSRIPL